LLPLWLSLPEPLYWMVPPLNEKEEPPAPVPDALPAEKGILYLPLAL